MEVTLKLKTWIDSQKLTYREAAAMFGCSEARVRHMCRERDPVTPSSKLATRIVARTEGAVTYADLFMPISVPVSDAAA